MIWSARSQLLKYSCSCLFYAGYEACAYERYEVYGVEAMSVRASRLIVLHPP